MLDTPQLVRQAQTVDGLRFVSAEQAMQAEQSDSVALVFIDVRTSTEFTAAHIPGALNIQNYAVPDAIGQLPPGKAWVVYCTCPDDRLAKWAVAAVDAAGVSNAVVLEHGLGAWQAIGGQVAVPDGTDQAVQQGCGCTLGAEAVKLWAIGSPQIAGSAPNAALLTH